MNVTINIYGDVHIHCDCCDGCGVYDDNFDDALEAPHEAVPDAEDGGGQTDPTAEEAEAAVKALAAFFLPLFSEETGEGGGLRRVPPGAGADAGAADPQGERGLSAGAERTEPADHRAAARGKIAMAHRAATDEICVAGGMGNAPSSKRRGLVRVSACCLLAPKDLACHVCREPHITRGERCSLFTYGSQNKQGKRIVTRALSQSLCKIRPQSVHFSYAPYTKSLYKKIARPPYCGFAGFARF